LQRIDGSDALYHIRASAIEPVPVPALVVSVLERFLYSVSIKLPVAAAVKPLPAVGVVTPALKPQTTMVVAVAVVKV
jgi:hypothetical protein